MHAERKAFALALVLAATSWLLDASIHQQASGGWGQMFDPHHHEFFSRLIIAALFLVFGLITGRVLHQRRLAQDQLREARARSERLFEQAPDAMWEVTPQGVVARANLAMGELAGLPVTEVVGRQCHEVLCAPCAGPNVAPCSLLVPNLLPMLNCSWSARTSDRRCAWSMPQRCTTGAASSAA